MKNKLNIAYLSLMALAWLAVAIIGIVGLTRTPRTKEVGEFMAYAIIGFILAVADAFAIALNIVHKDE